ncbi:universal stress protein [Streptomyces sp. NPDC046831]|uniref:universal stress protein n=1 Tax=Streptomyces sp. NPDC046831 TaxID=3154805 RepID=UPI0033D66CDD
MLRTVAVGVDGSPESLAAAHWAAQEALRRGAGLDLVHAWRRPAGPAPYVVSDTTDQDWAELILRQAVDSVRAAHPTLALDGRLIEDTPVAALLTAAADAELLVVGSLGLGTVAGFVTGSVSQRVVARSSRPVVLVRAGQSAADDHLPAVNGVAPHEIPETPYRAVVLGLDIEHPYDELIEFAFDAARRRGTDLCVVHARKAREPDARTGPARQDPASSALPEREKELAAALRPWCEKYPEVPVTRTVTAGRPAAELVHAASAAGLVVVGRRAAGRLGTHMGPVVHAVLHHAGCPVAVVPHP